MTAEQIIDEILAKTEGLVRPVYRGQADETWKPLSGAVRRLCDTYGEGVLQNERRLSELLSGYHQDHLISPMEVIDGNRQLTAIQRLSILQHYGAATALLDFTEAALVALWFACTEEADKDGQVFVLDIGDRRVVNGRDSNDPFNTEHKVVFYEPDRSLGVRIVAQQSVFVICNPQIPAEFLDSTIIPRRMKEPLIGRLRQLGISNSMLFGDVPGLARSNTSYTPLPPEESLTPEAYRDRGMQAYRAERYGDALVAFQLFADAVPRFAQPHALVGDAHAALRDFQEAASAYERAIAAIAQPLYLGEGTSAVSGAVAPGMLHLLHYNLGNARAAMGEYEAAIANYDRSLEVGDEQRRTVLYNRGNAKFALAEYAEAEADFRTVWSEQEGNHAALAAGNCNVLLGRFEEAMRWYLSGSSPRVPGDSATHCRENASQLGRLFEVLEGHGYRCRLERLVLHVETASATPTVLPFGGQSGNTGNTPSGMLTAPGGEGYSGMPAFSVVVRPPST